jgi:hypothetical protein
MQEGTVGRDGGVAATAGVFKVAMMSAAEATGAAGVGFAG